MESIYKELSVEDCHEIICNDIQQTNVEVVSYKIRPFSDKIEGLLGQHFKLEITYKAKESLKTNGYFMKIVNGSSKVIFEMCLSINAYGKEDFFYNVLLKEFVKFNIDTDFVPKCYFSKPYLIVLEDMSLKNYSPIGMIDSSIDHCKKALKTIAKLHSGSILYEAAKSKELEKPFDLCHSYPGMFKSLFFSKDNNFAQDWLYKSCDGIYELIHLIPENHIKKQDFQKKFLEFIDRMKLIESSCKEYPQSILHGDLWCNNFLFSNDETASDTLLLDFQLLKYGPPMIDVMNFLYTNTRKKFRDAHRIILIDYYYECVKNNLVKHHYSDIPSKTQYLLLSSDFQILIKLLCLCDRAITLMFDDDPGVFETDESLRRYLFDDRTANLIKTYKKNTTFKEIIEEDVCELRDLLFANI